MGRFWIGLALLLGFSVLGFGVSRWVEHSQQPITAQLEKAAEYACEGASEKAAELAHKAQSQWQRYREGMACVTDHGPMDEIDSLFAQIQTWAAKNDQGQLAACCARVCQLIRAITEGQQFTWWNLL